LRILAWDIETGPNLAYVWGLWDQNVALNQIEDRGEVLSFAARWVDEPKNKIVFHRGVSGTDEHRYMVNQAWDLLHEADALVSWNGKGFDTKHMNREFLLHGLNPPSPAREIDLMLAARSRFRFVSNKLENVAQELGLGGKVKHSGFDLWRRCLAEDPKAWTEMEKYNKQDVHLLVDLYFRMLPWLTNHPNRNLYDPKTDGCTKCPAGPGDLVKQGFRPTMTGMYQRYQCSKCGSWSSEGTRSYGSSIREEK
jgi:hypothetical protein